jgi:hypothetical protein
VIEILEISPSDRTNSSLEFANLVRLPSLLDHSNRSIETNHLGYKSMPARLMRRPLDNYLALKSVNTRFSEYSRASPRPSTVQITLEQAAIEVDHHGHENALMSSLSESRRAASERCSP